MIEVRTTRLYDTSDVFDVDIGMFAEEDNDEEENSDDDDDDDDEETIDEGRGELSLNEKGELGKQVTSYKKRRAALASALAPQSQRPKQTWEERYDSDPLRGDAPTQDFLKEAPRFTNEYTAICSDFSSKALVDLREEVWIPHLQWARRSVLARDSQAAVTQEYTRLTDDLMQPIGQILNIQANSTDDVHQLLQSEPFVLCDIVEEWKVFRTETVSSTNLTNSVIDPQIFVGLFEPHVIDGNNLLDEQVKYHEASGTRVIKFNRLYDVDNNVLVGVQIVFNAKSNVESDRYMSDDPMRSHFKANKTIRGPINEQDVDGLHHLMARSFAELTQLEQIHYMDPEDIFLDDYQSVQIEGLEEHFTSNKLFIEAMNDKNITFRYDRLDLKDFVADDISKKTVATRNYEMSKFQRVRLHSAVEDADAGNVVSSAGIVPAETTQEE